MRYIVYICRSEVREVELEDFSTFLSLLENQFKAWQCWEVFLVGKKQRKIFWVYADPRDLPSGVEVRFFFQLKVLSILSRSLSFQKEWTCCFCEIMVLQLRATVVFEFALQVKNKPKSYEQLKRVRNKHFEVSPGTYQTRKPKFQILFTAKTFAQQWTNFTDLTLAMLLFIRKKSAEFFKKKVCAEFNFFLGGSR